MHHAVFRTRFFAAALLISQAQGAIFVVRPNRPRLQIVKNCSRVPDAIHAKVKPKRKLGSILWSLSAVLDASFHNLSHGFCVKKVATQVNLLKEPALCTYPYSPHKADDFTHTFVSTLPTELTLADPHRRHMTARPRQMHSEFEGAHHSFWLRRRSACSAGRWCKHEERMACQVNVLDGRHVVTIVVALQSQQNRDRL